VVVDLSGTVASCHQFADVITAQVPMCYRGSCVLMFACVYKTSFMNFWQTELRFASASLSLSVSVCRSRPRATQTMTDPIEMLFRKWSHGAQPPKQLCIRSGPGSQNNDTFGKTYLHMPRLARGRYSQPYSLGGSSDAASGYQYYSNLLLLERSTSARDGRGSIFLHPTQPIKLWTQPNPTPATMLTQGPNPTHPSYTYVKCRHRYCRTHIFTFSLME